MSCYERSEFVPDQGVLDQSILKSACESMGWKYRVSGRRMVITSLGSRIDFRGEAALIIEGNQVKWNSYFMKDGRQKLTQLQAAYQEEFLKVRIAYALEAVQTEFKSRGFSILEDLHFRPDQEIKHGFYVKGKSKIKGEKEPYAKVKVRILANGTIRTDSDYIPEDIHELADEAMESIEALMGTKRTIKPKKIPAKHANKAFCKARKNIKIKQSGK